jgi:hypothetical protein
VVFPGSLLGGWIFLSGVIFGVGMGFAYQKKSGMECGCGGFYFSTYPLRNSLLIRERRKRGSVALCGGCCGGKNWGKEISPHKGLKRVFFSPHIPEVGFSVVNACEW